MKRFLAIFVALCAVFTAVAQSENSIIIDQKSFRPVHTDALTGANIDPISVDSSRNPCARIKVKINRMTREDIDKIDVKIITNNQLTKCKTADYENGLILEMTAKSTTRFYFNHPEFGQSNEVTLDLVPDKEYCMEASLNQLYSIVVNSNFEGAEVYIDNIYKGVTANNYQLIIKEVLPGEHTLKVVYGGAQPEQKINVHSGNISFRQNINIAAAVPQHVIFKLTPMDAMVEIDGSTIYGTVEGEGYVDKQLKSGSYDYTVSAPNYHAHKGTVIVRDQKVTEVVTLQPAFGFLQIANNNLNDATVYIDNRNVGKMPIAMQQLSSGEHQVRILKPRYKPFATKVMITDTQTANLTPQLEPAFAKVTLRASGSDTEIWLNEIFAGKGSYTTELDFGSHSVEGRKAGHRSTPKVFDIRSAEATTIDIAEPTPVYGAIDVSSTPMAATIFVDGKNTDKQTPDRVLDLLVGEHIVTVEKSGYKTKSQKVTVVENELAEVKFSLVSDGSVAKPKPAKTPAVKSEKQPKSKSTPTVKPQTKNRFESSVDLGYSMHEKDNDFINHFTLSYIGGLRMGRIFVGLGLGAEYSMDYINNDNKLGTAYVHTSTGGSGSTTMSGGTINMPLYLHLRAYLGQRERTFCSLSAGGKLFGSDTFEREGVSYKYSTNGLFADLNFGLKFGKFFCAAGVTTQSLPYISKYDGSELIMKQQLGIGAKISLGFTF